MIKDEEATWIVPESIPSTVVNGGFLKSVFFQRKAATLAPHCVRCSAGETQRFKHFTFATLRLLGAARQGGAICARAQYRRSQLRLASRLFGVMDTQKQNSLVEPGKQGL